MIQRFVAKLVNWMVRYIINAADRRSPDLLAFMFVIILWNGITRYCTRYKPGPGVLLISMKTFMKTSMKSSIKTSP